MAATLSNTNGIGLALAVWLAHNEYDAGGSRFPGRDVISATALLKPTRQLILANRVAPEERLVDVSEMIASRLGHAIHDSIEHAWKTGYREALALLGYPKRMVDLMRINPQDHELAADPDIIPVYLEQRFFREVDVDGNTVVVSGKFDQIINGELNDTKTTSVYTWIKGSKTDDYALQGSIYRWINPDKVTSDVMRIQHVFTDWQRAMAKPGSDYPASRVVEAKVRLLSPAEVELWIRNKIRELVANQSLPEAEILPCTEKDLWMSPPVYKYYSDARKAAEGGRATKNFPNYPAAASHCNQQGKGVVVTVPSEPKACAYCAGFDLCTQKDQFNFNPQKESEDA